MRSAGWTACKAAVILKAWGSSAVRTSTCRSSFCYWPSSCCGWSRPRLTLCILAPSLSCSPLGWVMKCYAGGDSPGATVHPALSLRTEAAFLRRPRQMRACREATERWITGSQGSRGRSTVGRAVHRHVAHLGCGYSDSRADSASPTPYAGARAAPLSRCGACCLARGVRAWRLHVKNASEARA
jgi:hypothetical protein